ncbi:hypothetical protein COO60DRAFT_1539539, partial [Scenedesmus sp. NREL 46B-D3]
MVLRPKIYIQLNNLYYNDEYKTAATACMKASNLAYTCGWSKLNLITTNQLSAHASCLGRGVHGLHGSASHGSLGVNAGASSSSTQGQQVGAELGLHRHTVGALAHLLAGGVHHLLLAVVVGLGHLLAGLLHHGAGAWGADLTADLLGCLASTAGSSTAGSSTCGSATAQGWPRGCCTTTWPFLVTGSDSNRRPGGLGCRRDSSRDERSRQQAARCSACDRDRWHVSGSCCSRGGNAAQPADGLPHEHGFLATTGSLSGCGLCIFL